MVQYASITRRDAFLSGEFGESYARKLFGDVAVSTLPHISRGKRKGAIKGQLIWEKCVVGGWHRCGAFSGVVTPGFVRADIVINGQVILTTSYSSFEKKSAAEAREASDRAKRNQDYEMERAELLWFTPKWPRMELPAWKL